MNKSTKPRKTGSKRTTKGSVPQTRPESMTSANLAPEQTPEPEAQALMATVMNTSAATANEAPAPGIDVLAPWNPECENPASCPYEIPPEDGETGVGIVRARVKATRAAPEYPLGHVYWEYRFLGEGLGKEIPIGGDDLPKNVESYEVARTLRFPYDPQERVYELLIWVYNKGKTNQVHRNRRVIYRDKTAPKYEILSPKDNAQVPLETLVVNGWAEDRQSGVAAVEWSQDGSSSYNQVPFTPDPQDNHRVNWHFEVPTLRSGPNTITVRFRDKRGNTTLAVINVTAAGEYKPKDDLGSLRAYLEDLIEYAATHIKFTDEELTKPELVAKMTAELTRLFYQPFAKLIDTYDASVSFANQPVNQLRAAIEVLRRYLTSPGTARSSSQLRLAAHTELVGQPGGEQGDEKVSLVPGGSALALSSIPAVIEADYRLAAYQALLNRIGTSYEEIRLARGADEETRKALASRLGIPLDPGINQLEKLYLPTSEMTESNLESLFGLADTARDQLTPAPEPKLLEWRRTYLQNLWYQQDLDEYSRPKAERPIVDPDLISQDDLRLPKKPDPAFNLWDARTQWLASVAAELQTIWQTQPTTQAGFEAVIQEILGKPVTYLLDLNDRQKEGEDIAAELDTLHLTQSAFKRLLRVWALVKNSTLTDPDRDDVNHILIHAKKQQNYKDWRMEETDKQIALTPKFFQISGTAPQLPPWRATWRARLNWLDALQARIHQLQTTEDALRAAVSAVEEQTLPLLRDALISALAGQRGRSAAEEADWLVNWLLVDLKTNASQRTTRLIQAIETVQGVLFSLRAGQLDVEHPVVQEWKLTSPPPPDTIPEAHFDKEWEWMGNYSTWRAAMFVFFFPETVLLPSLRIPFDASQPFDSLHCTSHFQALLKELRKRPRLSPEQARSEASKYLNNLLDDKLLQETVPNPMPPALRNAINATRPSPDAPPTFLTDQHTDETLGQRRELCRAIVAPMGNQIPNYVQEVFYSVPLQLAWQLQKSGEYLAALDWFQTIYAYNLADKPDTQSIDERKIYYGLQRETNVAPQLSRSDHWLAEELNPHALAASRIRLDSNPNSHTRYTLMSLASCLMEFADSEFTRDTAESLARSRALYLTAERILSLDDLAKPPNIPSNATDLPNPLLELLQLRVQIQLTKMRQGRNIAGMKRQVELPVSLPPRPSDLPMVGPGGQLIIPGTRPVLRPTPYYFRVLMERSKQLVNIAQQIEGAYLAALEKLDAENYNLLRANNDLQLAFEGVELQNRRVHEAETGVGVARAQLRRAQVMSERYSALSSIGLNQYERQMIQSFQQAISMTQQAGQASAEAAKYGGEASALGSMAAAQSSFMAVGAGMTLTYIPNLAAAGLHMQAAAAATAGAAAQARAAILSANAQVASTQAQILGVQASAEWRQKEFETQAAIADQEIAIGEAQIGAAQAHVSVADQERRIAQTQVTQAQAVAEFLAKKFTNAELYEWMSGVLGEVYSYFLQQATALAQLAENQLAFERQETPPKFIQVDYWDVPSEGGSLTTDQKAPDRKGLTGSARLLRDLYQLDQYAFDTDKRKLNLSQTFSLARMAPLEFEQFRQTGVLTFATPMALFDQEFPGHYLRLIKRVRTSVIALIPPHHGIRASLIASGISRVVTGGDIFQQIVVRRDPELVALTSPLNATGVFELDVQSEMHLPFESMGVDTFWQFEMPRAANPFDFRTVADVLVTIEYTALNSFDYRQQVIKLLDPSISGERSYIFTSQFADAWYDLHNPEQSDTPMVVKFKTWREDFPANLDELKIEQVLLFFSRVVDEPANEQTFKVQVQKLMFTPRDQGGAVGYDGTDTGSSIATIDGKISTRDWNGTSLTPLIGKSPAGEWELAFPNTDEVKGWFKDEKINDILLVITYGGRTPAWPA